MKKRFFGKLASALVLFTALFTSCDLATELGIFSDSDIQDIRDDILLSYDFTETGSTFTWTKPDKLSSIAKNFFISEDSNESHSDTYSVVCKIVDEKFRPSNSSDQVTIKKELTSVDFTFRPLTKDKLYLWVYAGDKYYNLGQFKTKTTETEAIKQAIKLEIAVLNGDKHCNWVIPSNLSINPMRFVISEDSKSSYSSSNSSFNCLIVEESYRDPYYNDTVSIKAKCFTNQGTFNSYDVILGFEQSISDDYYLWIQKEDGSWANLGKFAYGAGSIQKKIESIKMNIKLYYEYNGSVTKFTWTQPSALKEIANYLLISEDSSEKTTDSLTCKVVDPKYRETTQNDSVSIYKNFTAVEFSSKFSTSNSYYLWVHANDGVSYNLGEFKFKTSN